MGFLRHPRTTQERRANQEGPGERLGRRTWCRAKRRCHRLPNAWDDMIIYNQKCWKKYRKTQYRPVEAIEELPGVAKRATRAG